ncbi:sensor histidine kinase VxrA [Photobacterium sanguinicancri]|uniref:histidine kinase n=1 Tax=Photobacterium sanguinicancri TaxID=875932 RepID=A0AAW7YEK7_9GAMM|nr:sensor histidine kinase VxrA [Photobacterium sanguinicancri]MDO6545194.1 sensor histidine kinase VxrA [Photobacterium sanguinicancri]
MKKTALLLSLFFSAACTASVQSLPERLDAVRSDLLQSEPLATYDFRQLQSLYPHALLKPSNLLPQTAKYPLKSMTRLYAGSQSCKGPWPVSPLVTQPVVYTRAICNNTKLPAGWFIRSGYIHPGGGSYAYRYIKHHPDKSEALSRFLHIQEKPLAPTNSELGRLQRMDSEEIDVFIAGAEVFVSNGELWVRNGNEYHIYGQPTWSIVLERYQLLFKRLDNTDFCLAKTGNICWQDEDRSQVTFYLLVGLAAANIALLVGWGVYRLRIRRRAMQERMLVLQILTHELRTPIASLAMTVEGFRRHFDALPESLYDEFRRLTEDSRRLRQLAEASKDYLQANQQQLSVAPVDSFNEWTEYLAEPYDVNLVLPEDRAVSLNVYWLGTCIDNLLSNAQKYGITPITLTSSFKDGKLIVTVEDKGQLGAKDWSRLRKPFVSEKGLGLGLTIVESMIRRMGGRMKLIGPPTTFILEIPCESNSATG